MPRQRKAVRVRSGPPEQAPENPRLWLTRAALGLTGLALVGIAAFLLGHQQGADSVIGALQSQGGQTLPDTTPPPEQEQPDEVPGDEAPVENGTDEQAPVEQDKPADSGVEAVDVEDSGTEEDSGAVEVSGDVSADVLADVSSGVALDAAVHVPVPAPAPAPVIDSGVAEIPAEPVGVPEPDVRVVSLEQPETTLPESTQPDFTQPEPTQPELTQPGFTQPVVQRQITPVEVAPQVRSQPSAPAEPVEIHPPAPVVVTSQPYTVLPSRAEPQDIGTNTISTIGANEVVLVSRG